MITLRIKADVQNDRRVIETLPPEAPTGPAELTVSVDSHDAEREKTRATALDQFLARASVVALLRRSLPNARRIA